MKSNPRAVYTDIQPIKNFRELLKRAEEKFATNVAYKYKKDYTAKEPEYIEKTYQNVVDNVKAVGTKLLDLGLEGKKAIIIGKNSYQWCISYFAVTTSNMVIAPLDVALPSNEIENLVKRSKAEVMIFDKKFMDLAKNMKNSGETSLQTLICMQDIEDDQNENATDNQVKIANNVPNLENTQILTFNQMLKQGQELLNQGNTEYEKIKIDSNKMAIMLFTSGTTSLPKIVMLSQNNICSNIMAISQFIKLYETDTLLSFLPLHHTFESTVTFLYGFYNGVTVAFSDGLRYIQQNLQEYHISVFVAVPLVLENIYKKIKDLTKEQVMQVLGGKMRIMIYGAAAMGKEAIIGYTNFGIEQCQGYGLTETSPVVSVETNKEKRIGSIGPVLDNLEVKIENPNEEGIGEILVQGPSVMLGYYENEEETKKALKDGWFHTGDYGYLDEDEFLYITGRKKDVIVLKNGKNVYPQEIEELINGLSCVKESLVYQREKDERDTMLCAKIIYDPEKLEGKTEEEYKEELWQEIKEMNQKLPIYKKIKKITLSTEELAKTTTHKIKRYEELKKVQA